MQALLSIRLYSVAAVLCFLASCTPQVRNHSFTDGTLRAQELVSTYGELKDPYCAHYLTELLKRINGSGAQDLAVRVLATDDLVALIPGNRQVMISRGFLVRLSSEAEIAFILTHEIGHSTLGHLDSETSNLRGGERKKLELDADQFAVTSLDRAGYDTTAAISALTTAYRVQTSKDNNSEYPNLPQRLQNISSQVLTTMHRGNGHRNSRDFQRCRQKALRG